MERIENFLTADEDRDVRLDIFLADRLDGVTRSFIKGLTQKGLVLIDGEPAKKAGIKLKGTERIEVTLPEALEPELKPEPFPLDILFEDDDVIVVNKPASMTVHPGAGTTGVTLAAALLHHCKKLSSVGGALRPGIVHRLDKDTTGVIVAAKRDSAHHALSKQFEEHSTGRRYHALVWGSPKEDEGRIERAIGRSTTDRKKISTSTKSPKRAATNYLVLKRFRFITLLELTPETGRTHQIRVHLKSIDHPILGDPLYGKRTVPPALAKPVFDMVKGIKRQCLHAKELSFTHPGSGERVSFNAPYPDDMARLIEKLNKECL